MYNNKNYYFFREWYSYHFPELIRIVPDNIMYARVANFIGDRKTFGSEKLEELTELLQDTSKAEAIIEAARVSMGIFIVTTSSCINSSPSLFLLL